MEIEAVGVDSGYDISLVHQELSEKGIDIYTPRNDEEPDYKVEFTRQDFILDEANDLFVCPAGKNLKLKKLNRSEWNITREYRSESRDCRNCLLCDKCLAASQGTRRIQVNIFMAAFKRSYEKDGTPEHLQVLNKRQIWCEGTFPHRKRDITYSDCIGAALTRQRIIACCPLLL